VPKGEAASEAKEPGEPVVTMASPQCGPQTLVALIGYSWWVSLPRFADVLHNCSFLL